MKVILPRREETFWWILLLLPERTSNRMETSFFRTGSTEQSSTRQKLYLTSSHRETRPREPPIAGTASSNLRRSSFPHQGSESGSKRFHPADAEAWSANSSGHVIPHVCQQRRTRRIRLQEAVADYSCWSFLSSLLLLRRDKMENVIRSLLGSTRLRRGTTEERILPLALSLAFFPPRTHGVNCD